MCGIVGIISQEQVVAQIYDSLIQLQHRGQDAAGIVTCNERLHFKMGMGLVRDIFQDRHIQRLRGTMGIGHNRYPTSGSKFATDEVQPFWTSVPKGIAFAHNGNIVNADELRHEVTVHFNRYLNTNSDSEVLLNFFAAILQKKMTAMHYDESIHEEFFEMLVQSFSEFMLKTHGSYSVVGLIKDHGLIAFRDPFGIRPLVIGKRTDAHQKDEYIVASEDTMFHMLDFSPIGDIERGEIVLIAPDGSIQRRVVSQHQFSPCVFEYVYFSRPDAIINDVSVYRSRLRMGENLGKYWKERYGSLRPDVIIPAPSTSNTMALAMAKELDIPYSEGLYKNPFIGRTFIMPDQALRRQSVRYKLTPQRLEIKNKVVMIVDDSIVRGTTSREIISMVRSYGAKQVWFASACPPVMQPCFYGVDIPTSEELIASRLSLEAMREYLGADILLYQKIEDLLEAVMRKGNHHIDTCCHACLGGPYVAGCR